MRRITCILALSISALLCVSTRAQTTASVVNLKCEYLQNPLGIDAKQPRLTWMLADERQGAKQTAYQIIVGKDSAGVAKANGDSWQTGIISSDMNLVNYKGKTLQPFTKYFWRVIVYDHIRRPITSSIQFFETGMMDMRNWKGTWISDNNTIQVKPAPYFRNTFNVVKKIRSARAYIAVGGLYELSINGEKIGNHRMDPVYTRFDRRTMYVTHDVTAQLQYGKNAIGVLLGNGWYNHQSTAVWNFDKAPWRNRPAFCMDLRIVYEDGSVETITSGNHWKTSLSPIVFNSIYTAEHYDARLEQEGWNTIHFSDTGKRWAKPIIRSAPSSNIVSQSMQPIRAVETIEAKR